MGHQYFSDRELGKNELNSEEISISVYNGIVGLFNKYFKNFSRYYPETCSDNGMVCDTNFQHLNAAIKAQIPDMPTPINIIRDDYEEIDKYALLDFVEFCYSNIVDIDEQDYHSYFQHYHIYFPDTKIQKERFREEVNQIFERNGIVFYLDTDNMIKRHLPTQLAQVLQNLNVKSNDETLNKLVNIAIENICKPKSLDRQIALEKIWDAFERLKTYYNPNNKKDSAESLISNIADGTEKFDVLLDNEFKELTRIGNEYHIRHFERNKIEIKSLKQVDYLFYRMVALIDLCMDKVNAEK